MAYKVYRTKGGFEFELPEGVNPLDDDVKAWVQGEERKAREASPEFKAKVEAQQARDREEYDPTKGMGVMDKTLANIGRQVSQTLRLQSLQLFPIQEPVPGLQVREHCLSVIIRQIAQRLVLPRSKLHSAQLEG